MLKTCFTSCTLLVIHFYIAKERGTAVTLIMSTKASLQGKQDSVTGYH